MQTTEEQRAIVLGILADFEPDNVVAYLDHVGFDLNALQDATELPAAWLGHYRLGQGSYDTERATMDLLTWPPIARRVFELQQDVASAGLASC